eukprot:43635-Rhodomonas_salina.1
MSGTDLGYAATSRLARSIVIGPPYAVCGSHTEEAYGSKRCAVLSERVVPGQRHPGRCRLQRAEPRTDPCRPTRLLRHVQY